MISISQIISILCLHSTYITHQHKKQTNQKTKLFQMLCAFTSDPAVPLPLGIFLATHITGD